MSNALSLAAGCLLAASQTAASSAPAGGEESASPYAVTLIAVGLCVLAIWAMRRISSPAKFSLARTPGRANTLTFLHVLAPFMVYVLVANCLSWLLTPMPPRDTLVSDWRDLEGVCWANTDHGKLYVAIETAAVGGAGSDAVAAFAPSTAPTSAATSKPAATQAGYRIVLFRDPARHVVVGRTDEFSEDGAKRVYSEGESGIDGQLKVEKLPDAAPSTAQRLEYAVSFPIIRVGSALGLTLAQPPWAKLMIFPQMAGQIAWLALSLLVAGSAFRLGAVHGMGLTPRHWRYDTGRAIVALLAVWPVCVFLLLGAKALVPRNVQHVHEFLTTMKQLPGLWKAPIIISAVVLAPIAEEVFFRGLLQSLMRRTFGSPWLAILFTSVLFMMSHAQNPQDLPALLALSVALGYNYERCGRLWAPILIHAMFNGLNVAMLIKAGS